MDRPGRSDDEAVIAYLAAIEARRDPPGSLPHPDESPVGLARADMVHGHEDDEGADELAAELGAHTPGSEANVGSLEDGFVASAADYGRRHRITYQGWLQAGVDPSVLARAGIDPDPF